MSIFPFQTYFEHLRSFSSAFFIGVEKMFLTKRYFKNFQYFVVGICVFMAAIIGSAQTALIIMKCGKKNAKKKA